MEKKVQIIEGANRKPLLIDVSLVADGQKKPLVIFCHGFKGLKDWGHFNEVAEAVAAAGFVLVKFNFSHNGTTPENPMDFADLEAFGQNNYTKELTDLGAVRDHVLNPDFLPAEADKEQLFLMGHSRGGATSILKTASDPRIKKLVTWASISDIDARWPADLEKWKTEGVRYILNGRTHQQMPLYYQLYEDFKANEAAYSVAAAAAGMSQPFLIIHGLNDEAVDATAAQELHDWCAHSSLVLIAGAGHTFGVGHPHVGEIPDAALQVLEESIAFLKG